MKLSLILEARDRASRAVGGLRRNLDGLGRAALGAGRGVQAADRSMARAERQAGRLERAARRMGSGLARAGRDGVRGLLAFERRLMLSQRQMEKFAYFSGRKLGGAIRYGALGIAGGAAAAGSAALYKVVTAGMDFEKYRTQLNGLTGSEQGGGQALDWVSKFAGTTPYELDQVMEAFIALKAYGIDPTDGSLRTLGDTAAGMGKDLMAAVEMMADAQTGEFERLKEFGIRASAQGSKVAFRFQRDGKTMTVVAKKNAADIQRALMDVFGARFSGGMARLAQTTAGKWSNLMDGMTVAAVRVWEGGVKQSVNGVLDRITAALGEAERSGALEQWARDTGKALGDFVANIGRFDFRAFANDIGTLAKVMRDLAGTLNAVGDGLNRVGKYARQSGLRTSLSMPWVGEEQRRKNRAELRGLNRSLGYDRNWGIPGDQVEADRERGRQILLGRQAQKRVGRARRDGSYIGLPFERAPRWNPGGGLPFERRSPFLQPKPGEAKISLKIGLDAGLTATPTKLEAKGVQVKLNTGRAMDGPA